MLLNTATNDLDQCVLGLSPSADCLCVPLLAGNQGFLRKIGVSADEFFIGAILAVVSIPALMAMVHVPICRFVEQKKNTLRNTILQKKEMCEKSSNLKRYLPDFEPVVAHKPVWQVPPQYSLKAIMVIVVTLQSFAVSQCSLLGFFERSALTTKLLAVLAFLAIPCGHVLYVYITLRGALQPEERLEDGTIVESNYRTLAITKLGSIHPLMKMDDLIYKLSIPPELSEKPNIAPPEIPEGTPPEEAKHIVEKHAAIVQQKAKIRAQAIRALGMSALKVTGKWVCKSPHARKWMKVNGSLIADKGPGGYATVTFTNVKRLLMLIVMCVMSSRPGLGAWQIRLLVGISVADLYFTLKFQPFRDRIRNVEILVTMFLAGLQMVAPVLLLMGVIEDQSCALFMMAINVAVQCIGVLLDSVRSLGPALSLLGKTIMMFLQIVVVTLIFMRYLKRKIKKIHVKPPAPVWTIIRTPPIVVKLMDMILTVRLMDILKELVLEVNPIMVTYMTTYANLAKKWMEEEGRKELEKQFKEVMDKERLEVDVTEFLGLFHRGASMHVFRTLKTTVKQQSQGLYDEAMRFATEAEETSRGVSAGTNLLAAAGQVMSPEMIKKLTEVPGAFGPVIAKYAKRVVAACAVWLKETGTTLISEAREKFRLMAEAEATKRGRLRADLDMLKLGELKKRAKVEGTDEDAMHALDDADDPKLAVVELLLDLAEDRAAAGFSYLYDAEEKDSVAGKGSYEAGKKAKEEGVTAGEDVDLSGRLRGGVDDVEAGELESGQADDDATALSPRSAQRLADKIAAVEADIAELQSQVDELAAGSHVWRKIFDVIEPGEVLTVDDFKFELHKIEVRPPAPRPPAPAC